MNIFVLDTDHVRCAEYHTDRHSVKMILEVAQMLSTAHRELDPEDTIDPIVYKKAHLNHPCTIWTRKTKGNYLWLFQMFKSLSEEYTYRYGKIHSSWTKLGSILVNEPKNIDPSSEVTEFALAMPDEYKVRGDAVTSYRNYYNGAKRHLFSWKNREVPYWVKI